MLFKKYTGDLSTDNQMKVDYISRECVSCGYSSLETLYSKRNIFVVASQYSTCVNLLIQICKDCGMVFSNPVPDNSFYREYYLNQFRVTKEDEGDVRRTKKINQFEFCKDNIPGYSVKGQILDIGAYDGSFLNHFKEDGWDVFGCDPSEIGCRYAKSNYNIDIVQSDYMDIEYSPKSFDIVTLFQTLEHIMEPVSLLRKVRNHLKDQGRIILEVPNLDKPPQDNLSNYFSVEHVNYFEIGNMTNCLALAGFKTVNLEIFALNHCLRIVAEKSDDPSSMIVNHYNANRARVLKYTEYYSRIANRIQEKIHPYLHKKIIIYGAGQHTEQLYREVPIMRSLDVVGLVDSDPRKYGKRLCGLIVEPPELMTTKEFDVVLISSYAFLNAIKEKIKEICGDSVTVLSLY